VIRDARYPIGAAVAFFLTGVAIGSVQSGYFDPSFRYLEELAGFLKDQNALVIMGFLFLKNATASFIVLWTGTVLGIVSLFAAVQNGLLMGAVLSRQPSVFLAFVSILPHGIFELPAFFMACGVGVCRGCVVPVRDPDQGWIYQTVCREGPVFAVEELHAGEAVQAEDISPDACELGDGGGSGAADDGGES